MFQERLRELINIIDFDLWNCYSNGLVVIDKKLPKEKRFCESIKIPCEYLADDQSRKIECVISDDVKWVQVRSMNMDVEKDDIRFFRACTQIDDNNDYYSFGFEKDGGLYDIYVGHRDKEDTFFCRKLDIVDDETFLTTFEYKNGSMFVSKKHNKDEESIILDNVEQDAGFLSFFRNGELLEMTSISSNSDDYYGSLVFLADNIPETCSNLIYSVSSDSFKRMVKEIPIFNKIMQLQQDGIASNLIDDYLTKYHLFQDNKSNNVK